MLKCGSEKQLRRLVASADCEARISTPLAVGVFSHVALSFTKRALRIKKGWNEMNKKSHI